MNVLRSGLYFCLVFYQLYTSQPPIPSPNYPAAFIALSGAATLLQWGDKVSPKPCNADAYFSCPAFSTHTTQTSIMQDGTNTTMHTPNTEYSPHLRAKIAMGFELGLQRPALKHKIGVNPANVLGLIARYKIQKSGKSRPRSGRPCYLKKHDLQKVFALINKDLFISNNCLRVEASLTYYIRTLIRELV